MNACAALVEIDSIHPDPCVEKFLHLTIPVGGYMMKLYFFYLSAYEHSYRGRPKLSFLFSEDELVLKVRRLRGGSLHPGLNPGLETRSFRANKPPKPGVYTISGYKKA